MKKYVVMFCFGCLAMVVKAEPIKILPAPQKLSEHVYAWIGPLDGPSEENRGFRMNMAFVVGHSAVAVIDTGYTSAMAEEMLAYIRAITPKPIRYAINTNSQPHRYFGNDVFREQGAEIIAHVNAVKRMNEMGGRFSTAVENILKLKPSSLALPKDPTKPIDADVALDLGGIEIVVRSVGPTHTRSQLVVEILSDNIIYASDILYSGRLLAVLSDSDIINWLQAFRQLKRHEGVLMIPGHGQPEKITAFIKPTESYLLLLKTHMLQAIDEMMDMQDAIDSLDQSAYSMLVNFEQLAGRNASWAYVTLEAGNL